MFVVIVFKTEIGLLLFLTMKVINITESKLAFLHKIILTGVKNSWVTFVSHHDCQTAYNKAKTTFICDS